MDHAAIDLGKFHSQIAILTEAGELEEKRIRTERGGFKAVFGSRRRMKVLIEASTESEWVAQWLEELGHEVIVADPNYRAMYAHRSRRIKTDRRDAWALLMACQGGLYRPVHRTSGEQSYARVQLGMREALVSSRTRLISLVEATLRKYGYRIRRGEAETFVARVRAVAVDDRLGLEIAPVLETLSQLTVQIAVADKRLGAAARSHPITRRLMTVPAVGPVTSVAFVSVVDEVERFGRAHALEAYLGLVPEEKSSGEKQHRGGITKEGNTRARTLLVEAGWNILMRGRGEAVPLRLWGEQIARRRGRHVAAVAIARRLAGILYAMWRDETEFRAEKLIAGSGRHRAA